MSMCDLTTEDILIALGDNLNHNFAQMQVVLNSMDKRLTSVESKLESVVSALGQSQGSISRVKNASSVNDQQPGPSVGLKMNIEQLPLPAASASFSSKSEDDDSSDENYGEEPAKPGTEIFCFDCKKSFVRGDGNFTRHIKASLCKPYQCKCGKLFRKKSSLTTHKSTHSKATIACYCGAIFRCEQYLKNHQRRVHGNFGKPDQKGSHPGSSKRSASPSVTAEKRSKAEVESDPDFNPFNLLHLQLADYEA